MKHISHVYYGMDLLQIRQAFLSFFENNDHLVISSAPLIPEHDDSILFVNAGMVPFKPYFLNQGKPPAVNIASCQKCIRAGGKHNDLDQVGYTKRHHTFFEMCGNFSFGGYANEGAIKLAWTFLTQVLHLDSQKLYVTVHPHDLVSDQVWRQIVEPDHILQLTENEWSMGGDGPCGMCTEIFYDHGSDIPGTIEDGDRFVEIWNIVIMTHNVVDGVKSALDRVCIDTGMGLERIAAVMAGTHDNYQAPFFANILNKAHQSYMDHDTGDYSHLKNNQEQVISGDKIEQEVQVFMDDKISQMQINSRILIDHARATVFAISDGVLPDTWGRGYVLRKIIRRALRHGTLEVFLQYIDYVIENMSSTYPEIQSSREITRKNVERENVNLNEILKNAEQNIDKIIGNSRFISAENLYTLHDRYGISPDLVAEIATKRNLDVDLAGFDSILAENRSHTTKKAGFNIEAPETKFLGYDVLECNASLLQVVKHQDAIYLVFDQTVFYAEEGGQESDFGYVEGETWHVEVQHVIKIGKVYAHKVNLDIGQQLISQDTITEQWKLSVNSARRHGLMCNHSATHLLLSALRVHLGENILQKGSLVKEDGLRFDFLYNKAVSSEQLSSIEAQVNQWIREDSQTYISYKTKDEAKQSGAIAMFGEKYGEVVRVVEMGSSQELCCGTHVKSTGQIGCFFITRESSAGASIRRIEAKAGEAAWKFARENISKITTLANTLGTSIDNISHAINKLISKPKINHETNAETILEQHSHSGLKIAIVGYRNASQGLLMKRSDELLHSKDVTLIVNYMDKKCGLLLRAKSNSVQILQNIIQSLGYNVKVGGRNDMAQAGIPAEPDIESLLKILILL